MEKLNKIAAPAGQKFRQLQKIVHDIKKNDGGLMQKLKNITKQAPPSVPRRDYVQGTAEDEEEWSDEFGSDYESPDEHSDTDNNYVVPSDDQTDDNYEPPPNANDHIPPSFKFTDRNGGYADKQVNRQLPSLPSEQMNKFTRPLPKTNESFPKPPQKLPQATNRLHAPNNPIPKTLPKPGVSARPQPTSLPPPRMKKPACTPQQDCEDEENYIMPEDDNYIDPTQSPPVQQPFKPPSVNRGNKPTSRTPAKPQNQVLPEVDEPVVYEVPETEAKPSPPVSRLSQPLPRRNSPPKLEPDQEYEVCDDFVSRPEAPSKSVPCPRPRNIKPTPQPKPKTAGLPPKDMNSNTERPAVLQRKRVPSAGAELPTVPPLAHKLPVPVPVLKSNVISVQKPPEVVNRYLVTPSRHGSIVEQDAGVHNKEWYAASFDRKTAEDALQATSKDGSFLVRKSTGQDSNQPFTLVVLYNRRVYNIPVRYIESTEQYALGREKSGEEKFSSVAEIIDNHQRNPLVLIDNQNNNKNFTKLKHVVKTS